MNTQRLLQDALRSLPDDHNLREVKFHLGQAIQKLTEVEEKKDRKAKKHVNFPEKQNPTWEETIKTNIMNAASPHAALNAINHMLGEEKRTLENIIKKRDRQKPPETPEENLYG